MCIYPWLLLEMLEDDFEGGDSFEIWRVRIVVELSCQSLL